MSDVGEPTPMKREQDREAEIRRKVPGRKYWPLEDVEYLLSELARLRTEAHQWDESGVTDAEVDAWPDEAQQLWGILHAALDRMPDEAERLAANPDYAARLEKAYDAIPAICRVRARSVLRATEGHPNE